MAGQFQDFAVQGIAAEGRMVIDYTETPVTLADGTVVSLRAEIFGWRTLASGADGGG